MVVHHCEREKIKVNRSVFFRYLCTTSRPKNVEASLWQNAAVFCRIVKRSRVFRRKTFYNTDEQADATESFILKRIQTFDRRVTSVMEDLLHVDVEKLKNDILEEISDNYVAFIVICGWVLYDLVTIRLNFLFFAIFTLWPISPSIWLLEHLTLRAFDS
jgi:hypothetical protein